LIAHLVLSVGCGRLFIRISNTPNRVISIKKHYPKWQSRARNRQAPKPGFPGKLELRDASKKDADARERIGEVREQECSV